ncbi:MAG: thiolase family protein, partial [Burkholderiales bacterium]
MSSDAIVIASAVRTPMGGFQGALKGLAARDLGGAAIGAAVEQPLKANPERIPQLKPAFRKDGTVTAANSSSISDGGAARVLMKLSEAERRGVKRLARIMVTLLHALEQN